NLSVIHIIHPMPAIALLAYPFRNTIEVHRSIVWRFNAHLSTAIRSGKVHGRGAYNGHVFVGAPMPFCGVKFRMHALVRKVKEEWLVAIEGVKPVERVVGQQIGGVATFGLLYFLTVDVEGR